MADKNLASVSRLLGILVLLGGGCGSRLILSAAGDAGPSDPPRIDGAVSPDSAAGCESNRDCPASYFCALPEGCGATPTSKGTCQPRLGWCGGGGSGARPRTPVCGCDGKTYLSPCEANSAGVNVAYQGSCDPCEDKQCQVAEGCCVCQAYDAAKDPRPADCDTVCDQSLCSSQGLVSPFAYCFSGRCVLGSKTGHGYTVSCSLDADCTLVDDCCHCVALPRSLSYVGASCEQSCESPSCEALGWGGVKARCLGGTCRLSLQ